MSPHASPAPASPLPSPFQATDIDPVGTTDSLATAGMRQLFASRTTSTAAEGVLLSRPLAVPAPLSDTTSPSDAVVQVLDEQHALPAARPVVAVPSPFVHSESAVPSLPFGSAEMSRPVAVPSPVARALAVPSHLVGSVVQSVFDLPS